MQLSISQEDFPSPGQFHPGQRYVGHSHFWERAMLSRRHFMQAAAGATGLVLGSGLWMPALALADGAFPRHIPGGFHAFGKFFHVFGPAPTTENSTIFDFHGAIGATDIQGSGTGTNTHTGQKQPLLFDVDMRFMQGTYIGLDGEQHTGTFSFI